MAGATLMHLVATCPRCGTEILVQTVECARCGHPTSPGGYVIAPEGSRYERKPVCVRCIDGCSLHPLMGPQEMKG